MQTIQITWKPHRKQLDIFQSDARFKYAACVPSGTLLSGCALPVEELVKGDYLLGESGYPTKITEILERETNDIFAFNVRYKLPV